MGSFWHEEDKSKALNQQSLKELSNELLHAAREGIFFSSLSIFLFSHFLTVTVFVWFNKGRIIIVESFLLKL